MPMSPMSLEDFNKPKPVSARQLEYLGELAEKLNEELDAIVWQEYQVEPDDMSFDQASELIDKLKEDMHEANRNSGMGRRWR